VTPTGSPSANPTPSPHCSPHIGAPDTAAAWAQQRTHHREHTPAVRRSGFDDATHTRATLAAAAAAARVDRALLILGEAPEHLAATS